MAVVVMGTDAAAVQAQVAQLRDAGRRAAGFVGDELAAAEAMGAELFGTGGGTNEWEILSQGN